jgi:hypothetical protein
MRAGERRDEWSGIVHALSYVDIDAWQRVTGNSLTHAEVDLLMKWDHRRRTILHEERERGHGDTQAGGGQQRGQGRRV